MFPYPSRYNSGACCISSLPIVCIPNIIRESHEMHFCHASHQVCQVIPISAGLLIERQVTGEIGNDGLPTLFTLLHPMGDLCPVMLYRPSASEFQNLLSYWNSPDGCKSWSMGSVSLSTAPAAASTVTVVGFFTDAQLHCVSSCECDSSSILLLHHATTGAHSLWEMKPAKPEVCIQQDGTHNGTVVCYRRYF